MSIELPDLSEGEFVRRLNAATAFVLGSRAHRAMYAHYRELRRWARRVALVGSGIESLVVERLFGESLAALPLVGESSEVLVDIGSGAGFPGLVLAAARPDLRVVLVEPRQRKWAFLRAAADRAALSCDCLNARVAAALPAGLPGAVDRITVRALRLSSQEMRALARRLGPEGTFLLWASGELGLPGEFRELRSVSLGESRGCVVEVAAGTSRAA